MSVAGKEFLHFRMEEEQYRQLEDEQRTALNIYKVEVEGIDYSSDEIWTSLKKKSVTAYIELKNREYDLRHDVI
jgi:hypothetical protein